MKNDMEVAAHATQAVTWCVFRKANSALLSSDLRPSTISLEMTDDEESAATGASTDGKAKRSSSSGAEEYSFLSNPLGAVKEPG